MFTHTWPLLAFVTLFATPASDGGEFEPAAASDPTIVEVAREAGTFQTLLAALEAADLTEVLQGEGPFTVFAPTDEAFAKLPSEDLDALLADKEQLTAVLTYHVVAGKVPASQVVGLESATTVNGASVSISVEDGAVLVDGARVVATDIEASNGIIHVIDAVILPGGGPQG